MAQKTLIPAGSYSNTVATVTELLPVGTTEAYISYTIGSMKPGAPKSTIIVYQSQDNQNWTILHHVDLISAPAAEKIDTSASGELYITNETGYVRLDADITSTLTASASITTN